VERREHRDESDRGRQHRLGERVDRPRHRLPVGLAEVRHVGIPQRGKDEREPVRERDQRDKRENGDEELQREEADAPPRRGRVDVFFDVRDRAARVLWHVVVPSEVRPQQQVGEPALEAGGDPSAEERR